MKSNKDLPIETPEEILKIKIANDDANKKTQIEKLLADNSVFSKKIKVSVTDGKVTLTGNVSSSVEKNEVTRVIAIIPGIFSVSNKLITPSPYCEVPTKF